MKNSQFLLPGIMLSLLCAARLDAAPKPQAPTIKETPDSHAPRLNRTKRGAYDPDYTRWPNNTVYYTLVNLNQESRRAFIEAARHISERTAVRFVERTKEDNYLLVSASSTYDFCGTRVGMEGGVQILWLNPDKCWSPGEDVGVFLHEIMHVLGVSHEHQRKDRNSFGSIISEAESAQTDINPRLTGIGPFDPDSVMIYTDYFKLRQGILARSGPRNTLSAGDIATLNSLYPARPGTAGTPSAPSLTDNGITTKTSTRKLVMPENSNGEITVSYPAAIRISRPTIQMLAYNDQGLPLQPKDIPVRIAGLEVQQKTQGTSVRIRLNAQNPGKKDDVGLILHVQVRDPRGQDVTISTLSIVEVVPRAELGNSKRLLAANYPHPDGIQRCLEAGRLLEKRTQVPAFLGQSPENTHYLYAIFTPPDPRMAVRLAPCDSEQSGQWWHYDSKSGELIDNSGKYALDMRKPQSTTPQPNQAFPLAAHLRKTSPVAARWQQQGPEHKLTFSYRHFPQWALSEMEGQTPGLAPALSGSGSEWQNWHWR
jgi:hypothetical protein